MTLTDVRVDTQHIADIVNAFARASTRKGMLTYADVC